MTTFDERDRSFENKFAHDEELAFRIHARRNKLAGLWAAEKLGKSGKSAEDYAKEVVLVTFDDGHQDVAGKLHKDFMQAGVHISAKAIQQEMEHLLDVARRQIMGQ